MSDPTREALWEELRFVKGATDAIVDRIADRLAALSTTPAPTGEPEWTDLAADIRAIDGNHELGAGALAEALIERGWTRRSTP